MKFQEPHSRFPTRPFWRDFVLAYVLIGVGGTLLGVGVTTRRSPERLLILIPACTLAASGFVVFLCALGWSLLRVLRARPMPKVGYCPKCGYDLRESTERCPECGEPT